MGFLFKTAVAIACICSVYAEERLRASSAPFISGDTFRSFADHIFDETTELEGPDSVKTRDAVFEPTDVKFGDVVFVKGDLLEQFLLKKHPQIMHPYVLICHNSDEKMPGEFARFLEDDKILEWFAQNVEEYAHPKLTNLPIGFANRCWQHGSIDVVKQAREMMPKVTREHLLYLNIAVDTCIRERGRVYEMFKEEPYCYSAPVKPFYKYLLDLASSKFVLSPRGNGIDCHRTWEALYMGAIPIVKTSSLDPMYEGLPVVIVEDWKEVTEEFLEKKYEEISSQSYNLEKLDAFYWYRQLNKYKKEGTIYDRLPFNPTERVSITFSKEPLDVVIPCVEKDLEILDKCLEGIVKYCKNVRNIYIVSSKPYTDMVEWFDEARFPFSKHDVAVALTKSESAAAEYLANKKNRCGWYYQQLLKLYAPFVIPGISSNVLVVDADVIFLKPVAFQGPTGAPLFNVMFEYHREYFDHIRRFLPGLTRVLPHYSGISHHMLFQRPILQELFQTVEALHGEELWRAFCKHVAPDQIWLAGASEYEIYFNYVLTKFSEAKVRLLNVQHIALMKEITRCRSEGCDYVACHSYDRPSPNNMR